jgi:hypothetical protein
MLVISSFFGSCQDAHADQAGVKTRFWSSWLCRTRGVVFYPKIADNATRSSRSDRNKPVNSANNNTRGETMKLHKILLMAVVLIVPANVWAYGEGGGSDGAGICAKVKFSEFSPINNSEVAPQSDFSFYASESTFPNSIKVTVKGQSIPLTVVQKQNGYKVSGKLPATLRGAYAKINIEARGIAQCEVISGWLVKVTQ